MSTNFIHHDKNALTLEECKSLIDFYENNEEHYTTGSVNLDLVDNEDRKGMEWKKNIIYISKDEMHPQSRYFSNLNRSLNVHANQYIKKYSFLNRVKIWSLSSNFKIKKYLPNEALSFTHCENSGYVDGEMERRLIAWMFYLNDVTDGGETEFPTQGKKFASRAGDVLIWPAYWTHPHHGLPSPSQIKYIVSGWFTYTND